MITRSPFKTAPFPYWWFTTHFQIDNKVTNTTETYLENNRIATRSGQAIQTTTFDFTTTKHRNMCTKS